MEQVTQFRAVSDDGTVYIVVEHQSSVTFQPLSGDNASLRKGARHWTLDDGSAVTPIDSETFKIVLTNEIILKL